MVQGFPAAVELVELVEHVAAFQRLRCGRRWDGAQSSAQRASCGTTLSISGETTAGPSIAATK